MDMAKSTELGMVIYFQVFLLSSGYQKFREKLNIVFRKSKRELRLSLFVVTYNIPAEHINNQRAYISNK